MKMLSDRFKSRVFREAFASKTMSRRIAHRIKTIREEREFTQAAFAGQLGTTQSVVSRWERPAYKSYSYRVLQKIAAIFDVVLWVDFISYDEFLRRIKSDDAWKSVEAFGGAEERVAQSFLSRNVGNAGGAMITVAKVSSGVEQPRRDRGLMYLPQEGRRAAFSNGAGQLVP